MGDDQDEDDEDVNEVEAEKIETTVGKVTSLVDREDIDAEEIYGTSSVWFANRYRNQSSSCTMQIYYGQSQTQNILSLSNSLQSSHKRRFRL